MLRRASLVAVLGLVAPVSDTGAATPFTATDPGGSTSEFSPPRTGDSGTVGG